MTRLSWGLLLALLLACAPARAQGIGGINISCTQTFQVSQGAVSLTKIVSAGGKVISVCGFDINAGAAAGTAQFEYGTGTNCGTGTTAITPAFSLGINGVLIDHIPTAHFSLPNNNDLCLVTTGTGPMQIMVYYTVN